MEVLNLKQYIISHKNFNPQSINLCILYEKRLKMNKINHEKILKIQEKVHWQNTVVRNKLNKKNKLKKRKAQL